MASDQTTRSDNPTSGQEVHVEKGTVPKITSHFESLADKVRGEDSAGDKEEKEQHSLDEISRLRATAQQNSMEAIRAAEERYNKAKESEKGSGVKDTALQKGQSAKETLLSAGKTAVDYTVPKAEQAKDYALQKSVAAKDVTLETGKGDAEYAGKVAVDVKEKATVAGWSATHYTAEKGMEGTKAAARTVQGAVDYAGRKTVEIVAKPLGAAKEAAVATGESMKEYTARKKEESEGDLEAKKSGERQETERSPQRGDSKEQQENLAGEKNEEVGRPTQESFGGGQGVGALEAIGETIMEIAQTTKELVIGRDQTGKEESTVGYESQAAGKAPTREGK